MPKRKWTIECYMCKTSVEIDAKIITSTDQGATFVEIPTFVCGKCQSACVITPVEVYEE